MQKLWLASYESDTDNAGAWFAFASDQDDEVKAQKQFKKIYKREYGINFSSDYVDVTELDNIDDFKIKLVPIR